MPTLSDTKTIRDPVKLQLLTKSSLDELLSDPREIRVPPANKEFRDGSVIPHKYWSQFDAKLACVPLQEIDNAYRNLKTFIVIGKQGTIHRYSAYNSLGTFSPLNPARKWALYVTTHWVFSLIMVIAVILNTMAVNLYDNELAEYTFLIFYMMEFGLKLICEGFFRDAFSYLRKPWNLLDVVVILTIGVEYLQSISFLKWARLLKIVSLVPEIKRCFRFAAKSVLKLRAAFVLAIIVISFWTLVTKQVFMGSLTQRCIRKVTTDELETYAIAAGNSTANLTPFMLHASNASNWLSDQQCIPKYYSYRQQCPNGYKCVYGYGSNPDYGYTNFDSFAWSFIHTLRIIDQDYLERILNQLTRTNGPTLTTLVFMGMFFFGTYALGTFAYALIASYVFHKLERKTEHENIKFVPAEKSPSETESQDELSRPKTYGIRDEHREIAQNVIESDEFEGLITLVILLDIFGMSLSHSQMSGLTTQATKWIYNTAFSIYILEFILKFYALGFFKYIRSMWRIFDVFVLLDMILYLSYPKYNVVLPFRMLKITPRWNALNITLRIMWNVLKTLWGFLALMAVLWAYFGLVGKSQFGNTYLEKIDLFENEELPRWSFVDFSHSAMIVFRSWLGESIEVFQTCLVVQGWECVAFFSVVALSGSLILMILTIGVAFITNHTLEDFRPSMFPRSPSILAKLVWYPVEHLFAWLKKKLMPKSLAAWRAAKPVFDAIETREGQRIISASPPLGGSAVLKGVSIFIIIIASVMLWLDNVPNRDSLNVQSFVYAVDVVFAVFFGIMSVYTVVVTGLQRCLASPGWIFDIFLVLETFLNVLYDRRSNPHPYPMFYFFRSFRPFMLISRVERLEIVVRGLLAELRFLWKFLIVSVFIWLFFGITGTIMFSGSFSKCVDPLDGSLVNETLVKSEFDCLALNFTWENSDLNFDHIGESFVSLTLVGKRNSWITILHDTFDFKSPSLNFQKEYDMNNFYFFLGFFICGVFGVVSMIFGVMYYSLEQFTGMFLTPEQQVEWAMGQKYHAKSRRFVPIIYPNPSGRYRAKIYFLVSSPKFDYVVMATIILDNVLLACTKFTKLQFETEWDKQMDDTLYTLRAIVLMLYVIEISLKLLGWGKNFFHGFWNKVDFAIVLLSVIDFIRSELAFMTVDSSALRVVRLLRIFQFQPFISYAKFIKLYFQGFSKISMALKNILLFQLILMYSYSLLGISKFGNVRLWKGLDAYFNFHTVGSSFRVLFMLSSMTGVDGILPVLTENQDCTPDPHNVGNGDCGSLFWGTLFVFSYTFVSFLNFVNLYFLFIFEIIDEIRSHCAKSLPGISESTENLQFKCNAYSVKLKSSLVEPVSATAQTQSDN